MRLHHAAGLLFSILMATPTNSKVLFDFASLRSLDGWVESSDTVREVGASKAVLSLQRTRLFQRAVFFTLMNPQPNGAGFAGVGAPVDWDLRGYGGLRLRCRAQGQNSHYKVVLRHRHATVDDYGYEQTFEVPLGAGEFADFDLPFAGFKAYYRGREVKDAEPLDLAKLTMFTLQMYGGVYSPYKQSGVSALEIERVEAFKAGESA